MRKAAVDCRLILLYAHLDGLRLCQRMACSHQNEGSVPLKGSEKGGISFKERFTMCCDL